MSEPTYREFQRRAKADDRTAAELIREAMEDYRRQKLQRLGSLKNIPAYSVGRIRRTLGLKDDLLDEMLGRRP